MGQRFAQGSAQNSLVVTYSANGLSVACAYRADENKLTANFSIQSEGEWKLVSVLGNTAMLTSAKDSLPTYLVSPSGGGVIIPHSGEPEPKLRAQRRLGGSYYHANFVGMVRSEAGIICRPTQFSNMFLQRMVQDRRRALDRVEEGGTSE